MKGNIITIVGGMIALSLIVGVCLVALWATTQPFMQKRDKLHNSMVSCKTEGVVCK